MNSLRSRLLKSEFSRNLAVMFSGNGLALILPFLVAPLISRVFTPEDFAGYELFVKILTLIAVVSSLRFEMAILLPASQKEADGLTKLSFEVLCIATLLSLIFVLFFRENTARILGNESLSELLWLLPLAVITTGTIKILTQVVIRYREFKTLATNKIIASGSNNVSKYLLGLKFPVAGSLVWGHIIGLILPILALFQRKIVYTLPQRLLKLKISRRKLFSRYRDFPLVNTFNIFIEEAQESLLLFLISAFYGELILGLFAFALRYLRVPLNVFGASLAQVLNEKFARERNEGLNIRKPLIRTFASLAAVCFMPFALLFFYGEPLFALIFGAEWSEAGRLAGYLAPWLFLYFVETPVSMLPLIVDRQSTFFAINFSGHLLTLAAVAYFGMHSAPIEVVLTWFTAIQSLFLLILIVWFVRIAGLPAQADESLK